MSALRSQTVLVTGATGLIGSRLVDGLLTEEALVHRLVRPGAAREEVDGVTTWTCGLDDAAGLEGCFSRVQPAVVLHLAGDSGVRHAGAEPDALRRSVEVNLLGTLAVVAAAVAAGAKRLVRAGGLEEYGTGPVPFSEAQREEPVSPYSAAQVAATQYCRMLQRYVATELVTLRPALTYGPGQSGAFLVPALIAACMRGEDFALTSGEQTRDLVYVDDVAGAFLAAAASGRSLRGEIVNVGSGVERRVIEVAEAVVRLTGSSTRLLVGAAPARPVDLPRLVCSTERARELLGWSARVELEDGLQRTIAAVRS